MMLLRPDHPPCKHTKQNMHYYILRTDRHFEALAHLFSFVPFMRVYLHDAPQRMHAVLRLDRNKGCFSR